MKQLLLGVTSLFLIFSFTACQSENAGDGDEAVEAPDYAAFDRNVGALRSLIQAHSNEDLAQLGQLLSDTMRWSPPYYNENAWLGKADYLQALQGYHNDFDQIRYQEGIVMPDTVFHGTWAGSVFPKETATTEPTNVRLYGTWTGTHSATGKTVGVKWFALGVVNADGKIVSLSEYFDVNGIAAQLASAEPE